MNSPQKLRDTEVAAQRHAATMIHVASSLCGDTFPKSKRAYGEFLRSNEKTCLFGVKMIYFSTSAA
jgi:hypothetical protein